jgi:Ca2+/Na+ antiporter
MNKKDSKKTKKSQYIIHVDLDAGDPMYDVYNYYKLSTTFADYLNSQVNKSNPNDDITINIHTNGIEENDKSHIKTCIINYYKDDLREITVKETNSILLNFIVLLFGVILIVLYHSLYSEIPTFLADIIDISGWFAIWEVVDRLVFLNADLRFRKKRSTQLSKANIIIKN